MWGRDELAGSTLKVMALGASQHAGRRAAPASPSGLLNDAPMWRHSAIQMAGTTRIVTTWL